MKISNKDKAVCPVCGSDIVDGYFTDITSPPDDTNAVVYECPACDYVYNVDGILSIEVTGFDTLEVTCANCDGEFTPGGKMLENRHNPLNINISMLSHRKKLWYCGGCVEWFKEHEKESSHITSRLYDSEFVFEFSNVYSKNFDKELADGLEKITQLKQLVEASIESRKAHTTPKEIQ